jgi:hypothetical protein
VTSDEWLVAQKAEVRGIFGGELTRRLSLQADQDAWCALISFTFVHAELFDICRGVSACSFAVKVRLEGP